MASSRFDAHLAPGLTRKVCQTVLFHHDLIGSARISECCRTSKHRLLNVFQHLRTHRHLQLLSDFVTHTSCRQGRHQHPFDKEQTLSFVQLCFTVFLQELVRKEQYQCQHEDDSSTPAERDNQETELVSELHTRGKSLELSVLLGVYMSPVVLRHVGVELHLHCGFQDQATTLFCPGYLIGHA